ncbi:hypothetical protein ACN42_g2299 [Penicillium freii]|uniref:Uncharacterized protein n=1 Tax=Penicillium freii TaxID=48697 RepID=A0A101MQH1_PENFR|nr:hypothetical protein ACN42_g2299 [Penicillium freii]
MASEHGMKIPMRTFKWVLALKKSAAPYIKTGSSLTHSPSSRMARRFTPAGWPNGKALDYESRDCRFDPCVGQSFCFHGFPFVLLLEMESNWWLRGR